MKIFFFIISEIRKKKNRTLVWYRFIKSLFFLRENFSFMTLEEWHMGNYYDDRKKKYKLLFQKKPNLSVIDVDLQSKLMIKFLLFYLLIIKKFKFKNKKNPKIKKSIFDYKYIHQKSNWDMKIKYMFNEKISEKFRGNNFVDYTEYRSLFKKFANYKLDKEYLKCLCKLFNLKNLESIILTQDSYTEWATTSLALKYKVKLIVLESKIGTAVYSHLKKDLNEQIGEYQLKLSKSISEKELKIAENNLEERVFGNYISKNMFYMKQIQKEKQYEIKSKLKKPIILFLHAFGDAPNRRILNKDLSCFVDFYDMALFIIDTCFQKKIPLYIKPHPNRQDYKSDIIFQNSIQKVLLKYKDLDNSFYYEWIDDFFPSFKFKELENPVAITGRGSVQLECGYLGIPMLTFIKTEHMAFSFSKFVKSQSDFYDNYLKAYENYNNILSKKDAILFEATMEKFEDLRIFELDTVSKFTKSYREPKEYILENAHFI